MQFYKMFLDESVRGQFSVYDMLAIIEWDVMVVDDRSFEHLYHAAFTGAEPFWMKGSSLAGTNFHGTAAITDNWHVLGHINGNAIYNNKVCMCLVCILFLFIFYQSILRPSSSLVRSAS